MDIIPAEGEILPILHPDFVEEAHNYRYTVPKRYICATTYKIVLYTQRKAPTIEKPLPTKEDWEYEE